MRTVLLLALLMSVGCGDDGGGAATTTGTSTAVSTAGSTGDEPTGSGGAALTEGTTQGEGTAAGSSGSGASTGETGAETTSGNDTSGTIGESSTGAGESSTGEVGESSTGAPIEVPDGVYLWTGANGRGGDMDPDAMVGLISGTGAIVELSADAPPADLLAAGFGTLVYMSPRDAFPPEVDASAAALVAGGGRLVLLMEHCKGGCYGNAEGLNALLEGLGAEMRFFGDGGTPLELKELGVEPVPFVTDGVGSLSVYYTGHIVPGGQTTQIATYMGETIVAHESVGAGEVVGFADGSAFGYSLAMADNMQFVRNFSLH